MSLLGFDSLPGIHFQREYPMAEVVADEVDQTIAPSANGKSAPFEGEDVGSIPTGASIMAPIHRCTVKQVGEFTFMLIEPDGTPFDVNAAIEKAYASGQCK
jgi:hypothetical protein